ncbi:MAG: KTSC domain-containing protein [Clostridia bacterium]|nr:KTSC domain-containing protein [Clostridia bacterium]MDD4375681.1 KTSC domain-containing protein [Clostridia bacterium]
MKRISISSDFILSIGYDKSNNLLEIEFIDETIYQYLCISEKLYTSLLNSRSKKKFYEKKIKEKYMCLKLR